MPTVNLDRRWWIAIGVVVVAVIALVVSRTFFSGPSEECRPVADLLAFNAEQTERITSRLSDNEGLPTATDDIAYQAWADGLAERAQRVTSPELAKTSTDLAILADEFVRGLPELRAKAESQAPGAPAPPEMYQMEATNARVSDKLAELSAACS